VPHRRTLAAGIHALRSLGGNLAFAILAALGFLRRLCGTGNPELRLSDWKPALGLWAACHLDLPVRAGGMRHDSVLPAIAHGDGATTDNKKYLPLPCSGLALLKRQ